MTVGELYKKESSKRDPKSTLVLALPRHFFFATHLLEQVFPIEVDVDVNDARVLVEDERRAAVQQNAFLIGRVAHKFLGKHARPMPYRRDPVCDATKERSQ